MSSTKRKRGCNYTIQEINKLLNLVQQYYSAVEEKRTGALFLARKRDAWENICSSYNAVATSGVRTVEQLKVLYDNKKQKARKSLAEHHKQDFIKHKSELPLQSLTEKGLLIALEQKKAHKEQLTKLGEGNWLSTVTKHDQKVLAIIKKQVAPLIKNQTELLLKNVPEKEQDMASKHNQCHLGKPVDGNLPSSVTEHDKKVLAILKEQVAPLIKHQTALLLGNAPDKGQEIPLEYEKFDKVRFQSEINETAAEHKQNVPFIIQEQGIPLIKNQADFLSQNIPENKHRKAQEHEKTDEGRWSKTGLCSTVPENKKALAVIKEQVKLLPKSFNSATPYFEDSMPLQQRLTAIASTSTAPEPEKPIPTLKSQPLSPTKLKVTRQSTSKPQQQQQQTPKPKPAELEEVQAPIREEVCLKWNTHHSNMQTAFPALLNKEQYCDVTLVADGMSLKCHKLILSSCSAYFDQVLEKVAPYQHPIIFMKDIPFNIMKSLCDFMYVGEVNILHSDLDQILAVGESLKIKGLANKSGDNSANKPSSIETRKVPVKTPKVISKPSNLEKNDSAEEPDITDPLDLMEPTYEEAATPDVPPALKRNDQARKSTGKRVRKRKHVEVDHEPSPPVFRMRKGTRSRPNVKVPRYFNANFDNSVPTSEPEPSEFVQSNDAEESVNDPFMNILDEIKTEPLDIEDNFEDESYIHEMSHRETDAEAYDPGPIVEETEKVLKKVRTYSRSNVVAKQEKPDPLNVDHNVSLQNQAEEMDVDSSEITENQEHTDYREETLPVLTGTGGDGDEMQIENSEREDMEVDIEIEEMTAEVNVELHSLNSESSIHNENTEREEISAEDTDRQVIRLENCEQENLPEIVNEQNETRSNEETQLNNTTDQTQPVENSDGNIENSDMNIENSDMNLENSDMHIENSDMIIENSDKEEIQGNKIDTLEKRNVHNSQDETHVDSCEKRDMTKEDSIQVVHSAGDNSQEESSDIIENETDKSDVQGVSKHCNEEEKTFKDSERNSENVGEETSEEKLNAVQDGAQEFNSEENQLFPKEKLQDECKSNDLSTTEEDPLL